MDQASRYAEAFNTAVASVLCETRKRKGLSRHDLSLRSAVPLPVTSIASYELGHRAIKLEALVVLCRALGEPLAHVVAEAERRIGPDTKSLGWELSGELDLRIDLTALLRSTRVELAPLRRWAAVRTSAREGREASQVRLGRAGLMALAELLEMEPVACLVALAPFAEHRGS